MMKNSNMKALFCHSGVNCWNFRDISHILNTLVLIQFALGFEFDQLISFIIVSDFLAWLGGGR